MPPIPVLEFPPTYCQDPFPIYSLTLNLNKKEWIRLLRSVYGDALTLIARANIAKEIADQDIIFDYTNFPAYLEALIGDLKDRIIYKEHLVWSEQLDKLYSQSLVGLLEAEGINKL
jgi:hypothetical protein